METQHKNCAVCAAGEDAQHPYDIVKSYKGLTVHIDNTDAEGRLVLADTLTYTQKHFDGVDTIFDYATLTGACVTALGSAFAGIWCNDDAVASTVTDAGEKRPHTSTSPLNFRI
jgi:leucyl aminopeptidase